MEIFLKNLIIIMAFLFSTFLCQAQRRDSFEIYGVIKGIGIQKILLGNKPVGFNNAFKLKYFDSCYSKNDSFHFKGRVSEPNFYSVEVSGRRGWITFVLENSLIKIKADTSFENSIVTGSKDNDEYHYYRKNVYIPLVKQQNYFWNRYDEEKTHNDSIKMIIALDSIRSYAKKIDRAILKYIKNHLDNFISLYVLESISNKITLDTAKKYFSLLSAPLQNHTIGKVLQYHLFTMPEAIETNEPIPGFTLYDTSGTKISSKDYKGRFVLLDFWASWCGPCIEEFPRLKKLYQKYKTLGLEIVGISIDTDKTNWIKAVKQNDIPWLTLSDLKGSEGKPYQLFDIRFIPQLYLIDHDGKLLYKNIDIQNLSEILSGILKSDK